MATTPEQPETLSVSPSPGVESSPTVQPDGNLDSVGVRNNYQNTSVDIIHVNTDKAINYINSFKDKVRLKSDWLASFGIALTALTTLITCTFRERLFTADTWGKLYWCASLIFIWLFILNISKYLRFIHQTNTDWLISMLAAQEPPKHPFIKFRDWCMQIRKN
jgi:hypothetical protein